MPGGGPADARLAVEPLGGSDTKELLADMLGGSDAYELLAAREFCEGCLGGIPGTCKL